MGESYGNLGGVDRGVYVRHNPWHRRQTANKLMDVEAMSVREAVDYTFPWTVVEVPLDSVYIAPGADEHKVLARSDTGFVLDVTSQNYGVVQPQVLADLGEAAQMADSTFGTGENKLNVFSLHNGKVNVLYMERDEPTVLGGGDVVLQRGLCIINSHNGQYALCAKPVSWVVECMNTMPSPRQVSISSIRHTKGAMSYVPVMRQAIVDAYANWAQFDAEVESLLIEPMLKQDFVSMVREILPPAKEDSDRSQKAYDDKFDAIVGQWGAAGQQAAIGSAWGALMAVNSYELWETKVKGDRTDKQISRFMANDFPLTKAAHRLLVSA